MVELEETVGARRASFRVVGPVCESSDDFGLHDLPLDVPREVAILDCGAYGFTMASRYNGRELPAEVFLKGGRIAEVWPRKRDGEWVKQRLGAGH